ncbi:MAG TPA: MarR family transcriptional regulator [Gaiellales bacterium]|nr:MarR family transcriptional regulator [Gaiellales bacterium]
MDDTWELLMDLVMAERARIPQIAAEFRLSPPQVHALRVLSPEQPLPMGRLAGALGCDASNVTGIVDRLEKRGLIERRPSPRDRRVKVLVVTAEGAQVRRQLLLRLGEPPQAIAALSPADRRRLAGILRRALSRAAAAPAP